MTALLVILALIAGAVGFLMASQATAGVGIICGACLLAILARVWQAGEHHRELRELLRGPRQ